MARRYSRDDRSRDLRRVECTSRVLAELSDALSDWLDRPEAWWIELGAIEPPALNNAGMAMVRGLVKLIDRLYEREITDPHVIAAREGSLLQLDEAVPGFLREWGLLGAQLCRVVLAAELSLNRLGAE